MLSNLFYPYNALFCSTVIKYTPVLEAPLKMCITGHKEVKETGVMRKKNPLLQAEKHLYYVV